MEKTYKKLSIHILFIVAILFLMTISLQSGFAATHNINNTTTCGINSILNGTTTGDIIELDDETHIGTNNTS